MLLIEPDYSLQYIIDYVKPVKTGDYAAALTSINNQYLKFLGYNDKYKNQPENALYIRQIKSGSIVTEIPH